MPAGRVPVPRGRHHDLLDLSLPAVPGSARIARDRVADVIASATPDRRVRDDVRLCVSEAVTNVVRHAYSSSHGHITLVVERRDGELHVLVRDAGDGIHAPPARDETRGFGFEIIRRLATGVSVSSAPGLGTEIAMAFKLDAH